ncbi:MAG: hypothetical protein EPN97_13935 [Alphaproteobacteria bacterium]|nr:MAG: hypothetical protein EPN97_13935 [Alphaproteobacteria bacterium]
MQAWKKGLTAIFMAAALSGCDAPPPGQQPVNNRATTAAAQPVKQQAGAYYVTVDLRQSHSILFSDPTEHIKDAVNAMQFALPTAKARYGQLHKGDNLVDKFRAASFWIEGNLGSTKMSVQEVPAVSETADTSACRVQLLLSQSNFTLDLAKHLKNSLNAVKFDWDVPADVYQNMKVGDDLIEHGFRAGSFIVKGSVGSWHLKVLEKKGPCTP